MDITPIIDSELCYISSYGAQGVKIHNQYYQPPLYISASLIQHIAISWHDLTIDNFDFLQDSYYDMLLIGTGEHSRFIAPSLRNSLKKYTLSVDFMPNRSTCHAFNVALSEQRSCAIILLPNNA